MQVRALETGCALENSEKPVSNRQKVPRIDQLIHFAPGAVQATNDKTGSAHFEKLPKPEGDWQETQNIRQFAESRTSVLSDKLKRGRL